MCSVAIPFWGSRLQRPCRSGSMPPAIQKRLWKSAFRSIRTAEMQNSSREFFSSLARIAFYSVLPTQRLYSLPARVVAALGADGQLAAALRLGFDAHGAKPARAPRIGRFVADGVLVADIPRHGAADLAHFIERLGKKCEPAGAIGDDFQSASSAFGMLFL